MLACTAPLLCPLLPSHDVRLKSASPVDVCPCVQTLDVELLQRGPREADKIAGTVPPARFAHAAAPVLCRMPQGGMATVSV